MVFYREVYWHHISEALLSPAPPRLSSIAAISKITRLPGLEAAFREHVQPVPTIIKCLYVGYDSIVGLDGAHQTAIYIWDTSRG